MTTRTHRLLLNDVTEVDSWDICSECFEDLSLCIPLIFLHAIVFHLNYYIVEVNLTVAWA